MVVKENPFWERPCMTLHFRVESAHIGLFELPRTSVSGHNGQTGASLDVGTTLAGSSCENIGEQKKRRKGGKERRKGEEKRRKKGKKEREKEEEKKEGKERREDKTKEVFGRSNFECLFFQ